MPGPDGVIDAQPGLVVCRLSWAQHILVANVVSSRVESSLHCDAAAAAEVHVKVSGVTFIHSYYRIFVFYLHKLWNHIKYVELNMCNNAI